MSQRDEVKGDSKHHNSVISFKIKYIMIEILAQYIFKHLRERSQMMSSKLGVFRSPHFSVIFRHFCHPLDDAIFHQPISPGFLKFLRCFSEELFSIAKLKNDEIRICSKVQSLNLLNFYDLKPTF